MSTQRTGLRSLWRQAFSDATLTLDFYHACGYLSVICKGIFAESEVTAGFKKLKLQLMRYGGAALMRYLPKKYAAGLATLDDKGETAVNYLKTRVAFMNYAWLRREHCYIGSVSMESARKFLVAARCKQVGIHWRHKNAAIPAAIRSNRKLVASCYIIKSHPDACVRRLTACSNAYAYGIIIPLLISRK